MNYLFQTSNSNFFKYITKRFVTLYITLVIRLFLDPLICFYPWVALKIFLLYIWKICCLFERSNTNFVGIRDINYIYYIFLNVYCYKIVFVFLKITFFKTKHTYGWRCESETRVPSSRGLVKQYNQELCISS